VGMFVLPGATVFWVPRLVLKPCIVNPRIGRVPCPRLRGHVRVAWCHGVWVPRLVLKPCIGNPRIGRVPCPRLRGHVRAAWCHGVLGATACTQAVHRESPDWPGAMPTLAWACSCCPVPRTPGHHGLYSSRASQIHALATNCGSPVDLPARLNRRRCPPPPASRIPGSAPAWRGGRSRRFGKALRHNGA
jgi:hypothetical protein